jgi:glycosyltransferase involved in cell wall biosynthesis
MLSEDGHKGGKMRILHLIPSFQIGGAERVALDLAECQKSLGHQVYVVALRRAPHTQKHLASEIVESLRAKEILTIDLNGRNFRTSLPYYMYALVHIVRSHRPDVVHTHESAAHFIVAMLSHFVALPTVVRSVQTTDIWRKYLVGYLTEHGLKDTPVIACSKDVMSVYQEKRASYGLTPNPHCEVIYNGVPVPPMARRDRRNQRLLRFGFFGRNVRQKGIDVLVAALTLMDRDARSIASFDFYTDAKAIEIGIAGSTDTVKVYPFTAKARDIMPSYDIIVVPSRFEGLPLVAAEAMIRGVPIVATTAPGIREVIPPNWPLSVAPDDPSGLAAKLNEICSGKFDLIQLGKQAREFTATHFSLEVQARRYLEVYRRSFEKASLRGVTRNDGVSDGLN